MNRFARLLVLALLPLLAGTGAHAPGNGVAAAEAPAGVGPAAESNAPDAAPVLSPRLRRAARRPESPAPVDPDAHRPLHLAGAASTAPVRVLIETGDPAALAAAGFPPRTVAGPVVTAAVARERLAELASVPGVRKVDLSLPLRLSLDVSMPEVLGDEVHRAAAPPYPANGSTGRGVVVGVIDTGIDIAHPDFRDEAGATRIDRIWDQRDGLGPSPAGYGYGTEWSAADIDGGACRQRDDIGHGTHVAGIAAGNGRGAPDDGGRYRYVGLAPEADLIVVKARLDESSIVDAVKWIFDRAGDRPCVVNLSLGSRAGPHDGTSSMDRALAALAGPGRLLVAAAGNGRGGDLHAGADLAPGASAEIELGVYPYFPLAGDRNDFLEIEVWYPGDAQLRLSFVSPNGMAAGPSVPDGERTWSTSDGTVYVDHRRDPINGDYLALIDFYDQAEDRPPAAGLWTLRVQNPTGEVVPFDLYIAFDALGLIGANAYLESGAEDAVLVESPASSDSVMAVAAYVTKVQWAASDGKVYEYDGVGQQIFPARIAPWSSPGPRRDGAVKPDIAAPGMGIVSARSANGGGDFVDFRRTTPDLQHVVSQGTSQAAPHVAGVAALVLEKHPGVGMRDLLARVRSSARIDPFTGAVPNADFGYGRINAVGAVDPPILLTSLTAAWESDAVAVRWTVSLPAAGARFRVERAPAVSGPFRAVSDELTGGDRFQWIDPAPDETEPWYRVRAVAADQTTSFFGPVHLVARVARVRLWQNHPNPARDATLLSYELVEASDVRLEIFDVTGRRRALLWDGPQAAGRHEVTWTVTDDRGRRLPAGLYFYRLTTPGSVLSRRLTIVMR